MSNANPTCPKVFISSTCFDLKDVRAEMANALTEWGYRPMWNESPDFPTKPGLHSHDVCLDAVKDCDVYVLIIDKRYGGIYAGSKYEKKAISITWYESEIALDAGKEIYVFVRDTVWNERATYNKNKKKGIEIEVTHVDDRRVFSFIDFIQHQPKSNWRDTFTDVVDLKQLLKAKLDQRPVPRLSLPPCLNYQTTPEPNFVGLVDQLAEITKWYNAPDTRVGGVIGWGGVGKSTVVRKWYDSLAENGIAPDGIFWWGFYKDRSLDHFLNVLLDFLAQGRVDIAEMKSASQKADMIKKYINDGEYLIVLDGLEEMQKGRETGPEFGCMKDRSFLEILKCLTDKKGNGLCLITTRYPLTDLRNYDGKSYRKIKIDRLSLTDVRALFEKVGVKGSQKKKDDVIEEYGGHALSLSLLAEYLVKDFEGDIEKSNQIPPFHSDKEAGGKAHRILLWYAEQLPEEQRTFMKIFSLFRRDVRKGDFEGVFQAEMETNMNQPLRDAKTFHFNRMVDNLCDRRLITKGEDSTYSTHPLIRNYFDFIFDEKDKKLCHKCIYQFIGSYAPERPDTLEEMQPLFDQVHHGCDAGLFDEVLEVLHMRIYRGPDEAFLIHKLGAWETALSLARTFFPNGDLSKMPLVTTENHQSWVLNEAGLTLLSTGRPGEAEEPFSMSVKMYVGAEFWKGASMGYQNLADLRFRIGEIDSALESANKALEMAEKAQSERYMVFSKGYCGWILYLSGKTGKAQEDFEEADEIEKGISGERLYSLTGIWHGDVLLALNRADEAFELSTANLEICEQNDLLNDISQCHRSLGAIERVKGNHAKAEDHLHKALEIARKVGVPHLEIEALAEFGRLHIDMGKYDEAITDCETVLGICDWTGFRFYEPEAEIVLARAYLLREFRDLDKAEEYARSAYDKAVGMKYRWREGDAAHVLGEIRIAQEDKPNAQRWLEKALDCRKYILDPNASETESLLEQLRKNA